MSLDKETAREMFLAVHEARQSLSTAECGCVVCKSRGGKKQHFDEPGIIEGKKRIAAVFEKWRKQVLLALENNPPTNVSKAWDESKHPRNPAGSEKGGEFTSQTDTPAFKAALELERKLYSKRSEIPSTGDGSAATLDPSVRGKMGAIRRLEVKQQELIKQMAGDDLNKQVEIRRLLQEHATVELVSLKDAASPSGEKAPQTETPEFKKWFGDSKVVDGEGKPFDFSMIPKPGISTKQTSPTQLSLMSGVLQSVDFPVPRTEAEKDVLRDDIIADLKRRGVKHVDLYHVTDAPPEKLMAEGIYGSAVSNIGASGANVRSRSVYGFTDPDDIQAGFGGILGAKEGKVVVHIQMPVDSLVDTAWDGNFNVTFGTYSGVRQLGNIPAQWIKGFYQRSPTQIKSATGNKGTFDPKEADITKAVDANGREHAPAGDEHGGEFTRNGGGGQETNLPESGKPFEFPYLRHNERAPNMGSRFGQDIEPAGRYVTQHSLKDTYLQEHFPGKYESGTIRFENPLVVDAGGGYEEKTNWKQVLSSRFGGKTGKSLSIAIVKAGYDGIVTVNPSAGTNRPAHTSEIVDLRMFKAPIHNSERRTGDAISKATEQPVGALHRLSSLAKSVWGKLVDIAKDEDPPPDFGAMGISPDDDMEFDVEAILEEAFPDAGKAQIKELAKELLAVQMSGAAEGFSLAGAQLGLDPQDIAEAIRGPLRRAMEEYALKFSESTLSRIDMGIRDMLVDGLEAGDSTREMADTIGEYYEQLTDAEAVRIARTEFARGQSHAMLNTWSEDGGQLVQWLGTSDQCEICAGYDGRIWPIEMAWDALPSHPHCRCSWTFVYDLEEGQEVETEPPTNVFDDPSLSKDPWPTLAEEAREKEAALVGKTFDQSQPRDSHGRWTGQADTSAFKAWFGNSKVVDSEGKPLVVYHGTDAVFDKFDASKQRGGDFGKGFYFTDSESRAHDFGKHAMASYLSLKNPYKVRGDVVKPNGEIEWGKPMYEEIASIYPEAATVPADEITGVLQRRGHDGLIVGDYYIAFRPEQIKSAIDNSGTWSKDEEDIAKFNDSHDPKTGKFTTKSGAQREKLQAVAFRYNGQVFAGKPGDNHGSLMWKLQESKADIDWDKVMNDFWHSQGFVDAQGNYLDRDEVERRMEMDAESGELRREGALAKSLSAQEIIAKYNMAHDPETGRFTTTGGEGHGIVAYHGTPYNVDRFSVARIGSGEGNEVFGRGLYFAEEKKVADTYRVAGEQKRNLSPSFNAGVDNLTADEAIAMLKQGKDVWAKGGGSDWYQLRFGSPTELVRRAEKDIGNRFTSGLKPFGNLYTVRLDVKPEELVDWDAPLSEQPKLKAALDDAAKDRGEFAIPQSLLRANYSTTNNGPVDGASTMGALQSLFDKDDKAVADHLMKHGFAGVRYLDQESRGAEIGVYYTGRGWRLSGSEKTFKTKRDADRWLAEHKSLPTRNYVIFDDSRIKITHANGKELTTEESIAKTAAMLGYESVEKYNPNHDERGRFATKVGSAATIVTHQGKVLIIKRGETAPWMPGKWNLPGGTTDSGEHHSVTAEREMREEAGIDAKVVHHTSVEHPDYNVHFYTTEVASPEVKLDAAENTEYKWVGLHELDQYDFVPDVKEAIQSVLEARVAKFNEHHDERGRFSSAPSNGTDRERLESPSQTKADLTKTPEFKQWFGQSKVVDVKGRPLIVYHGGAKFNSFSMSQPEFKVEFNKTTEKWHVLQSNGEWTHTNHVCDTEEEAKQDAIGTRKMYTPVMYATSDLEAGYSYASQLPKEEAEIKPLYLKLENPLDLRDRVAFEKWTGIKPEPSAFMKEYDSDMADNSGPMRSGGRVLAAAKEAGYDGIIFYDTDVMNRGPITSYAFFKPTQAKLAKIPQGEEGDGGTWWDYLIRQDGNKGTFNPKGSNIAKSDADVIAGFANE